MQENKRKLAENTVVIILAAGKGTRMGRSDLAKVCFEIDGIPAITRTITTFKQHGFKNFIPIVGARAEQVMDCVAKDSCNAMYIYQSPQLGTGHAAQLVAQRLQEMNYNGNIIVTMGDKFIDDGAIDAMIDGFIKQKASAALLTIPKTKLTEASGGRIFLDGKSSRPLDIIEKVDIQKQAVVDELKTLVKKKAPITSAQLTKVAQKHIKNPKKLEVALGKLLSLAKNKKTINKSELKELLESSDFNIEIDSKRYNAKEIERKCKSVNASLYMFEAEAFYQGVALIDNDNAQKEYYLTDIIKCLNSIKDTNGTPEFSVKAIEIKNPELIQGFNSPDELLTIQDYLRKKKKKANKQTFNNKPRLSKQQYRDIDEWIKDFEEPSKSLNKWLNKIYGSHEKLHTQRCREILKTLKCYKKKFGSGEKVCIVRAPGRINILGRHVDHRGGYTNFLAIDKETVMVAGVRDDSNVVAVNTDSKRFKEVNFNIDQIISNFGWSDWTNFVNSKWVQKMIQTYIGDWGNYIRAAMVKLQHNYKDVKVNGLNIAVSGNIPMAAGLSSSSSIVVATLQTAIALNNFELTSSEFIDMCGSGEWFVGSRGGAGDHAAIRLGQRGKIANVRHRPLKVEAIVDAPKDYEILIANSHIKAAKSSSAKDKFNEKIASYNLGFALLKHRCPEISSSIEHLRDINPETLGVAPSDIYRMLLKIPQFATRKELRAMLGDSNKELLDTNFASHKDPGKYRIRGVLLFGIAEIQRAKVCTKLLDSGRIEEFGELMRISHDGDRVSIDDGKGNYILQDDPCTDAYLNSLIYDLHSEDPEKVINAQIYMQPGSYACSTPEIDKMVDIVNALPCVAGVQLAGAGLGGCIMILAQKGCQDKIKRALNKNYYKPANLKPAVITCTTVEGCGLVGF